MSDHLWLLLDQGGHAGRVVVLNGSGEQLAAARHPVKTQRADGRVEQDPAELLASIRDSIDDVAGQLGGDVARIEAAALATQRSSVVCWDRRDGRPVSAAISWQDRRAAELLDRLPLDAERVRQLTGMRRSPHYGAGKLTWCLENLPDVRKALDGGYLGLGPLASYLLHGLLAGKPYLVDATNAQRSLLWSFDAGGWSRDLADAFGIPLELLPECVGNVHAFGHLQVGSQEIPLRICAGDQNVVPFAFDADGNTAFINAGTGAFLLVPGLSRGVPAADNGLLATLQWQDEGNQHLVEEGTVNGAGAALAWYEETEGRKIPWQQLDAMLSRSQQPPLFLNGIGGLGAPWWRPDFRSRYIGGEGAGADARLAAVVESIVFLLQANMERVVEKPGEIIVTGGLSRSTEFCRRIATLAGLPVCRSRQPEASLHGLARRLSPSLPALSTEAIKPLDDATALQGRYREFMAAMKAELR